QSTRINNVQITAQPKRKVFRRSTAAVRCSFRAPTSGPDGTELTWFISSRQWKNGRTAPIVQSGGGLRRAQGCFGRAQKPRFWCKGHFVILVRKRQLSTKHAPV